MFKFKNLLGLLLTATVFVFVVGCSDDDDNPIISSDPAQAAVRVIHTSYDAPAVDIAVDGQAAIGNLPYGLASSYNEIPAGTRNIKVTPAGQNTPIVIEANLPIAENKSYSVFAVNSLSAIEAVVAEDARNANSAKAKVRFLHASPDAPSVDIKLNDGNGPAVFGNAAFKDISDYVEVDAGTYTFAVTPAGSAVEVIVFDPITVANGVVYTVVAHGTLDNTDPYPFAVRVFVDNNPGNNFVDMSAAAASVMVVHGSPDAPGVDLLVDGLVVNSSALEFPNNTGYLPVGAGDRNIKVNASGTDISVINATLNLDANADYSVFAVDVLASISPLVIADDLTNPASGNAHVRFLHLSPDAPAVDITLTDGTIVFGDYEFKEYSAFTPLPAGTYDLQVRAAGTDVVVLDLPGITLQDGMIYSVFAKGLLNGSGKGSLGAEIIVNN